MSESNLLSILTESGYIDDQELLIAKAVNAFTSDLIKAGYIDDYAKLAETAFPQPNNYQFFADFRADARVILSSLWTAYSDVVNAGLIDHAQNESSAYLRAIDIAGVVHRIATLISHHSQNRWMGNFYAAEKALNEKGYTTGTTWVEQTPIKTFDEWLDSELHHAPEESDWAMKLRKFRESGHAELHSTVEQIDSINADHELCDVIYLKKDPTGFTHHIADINKFSSWLNENVEVGKTRAEVIVSRCANNNWKRYVKHLRSRGGWHVLSDEWTILTYSPMMRTLIPAALASATYINHRLHITLEEISEELDRLEYIKEHAVIRRQLNARDAAIDQATSKAQLNDAMHNFVREYRALIDRIDVRLKRGKETIAQQSILQAEHASESRTKISERLVILENRIKGVISNPFDNLIDKQKPTPKSLRVINGQGAIGFPDWSRRVR